MGIHTIRLPDIGEGIAEAELVNWHVSVGDTIQEDQLVAEVMTDKAAVEVPSSVSGKVVWLGGEIGDMIAIGAKLIQLEVEGDGNDDVVESSSSKPAETPVPTPPEPVKEIKSQPEVSATVSQPKAPSLSRRPAQSRTAGTKPLAAPSVRARAKEEGIDLRNVPGTGPAGRISHQDLSDFIDQGGVRHSGAFSPKRSGVKETKLIGMRRKIAEKMAMSKSRIPHITIVEEVDMTELEELRSTLNKKYAGERPKLTILPFMMRAIAEAVKEQPQMNARFDDDAGILREHGPVNIGIATQTDSGLNVTVVHHSESGSLWENASKVSDLAEEARNGTIKLDDLSGGTITITSLGALGAIATTPIINYPEVAIVGINKMQTRPMWDGHQFQPCKMMNVSCSFDHRVIDGWDAAVFVQKLKSLLETPAMLFVEG